MERRCLILISKGNLKLGTLPSFSLPVIVTCPGKTPFCDHYCYGLKGQFTAVSIKEKNDKRLDASLEDDFADIIVGEIRKAIAPAFRLHVIGDFYTRDYVEKWIEIAERLPTIIFFGSTRSWRCEFMDDALKRLRDLPNVYIKASVDVADNLEPLTCGWNIWSVEGEGVPCPHDYGLVESCAKCKRCWTLKDFNVMFKLRWGNKMEYLIAHLSN